jgi:hypothetical protein
MIKYLLDQHCHALPCLLSVTLTDICQRVLNSVKIIYQKDTLYDDLQAFLPPFREQLATCLQHVFWKNVNLLSRKCREELYRILCFVDSASLYNLVNKTNLVHNFLSMFISFLYMFWVTMCPSSGEKVNVYLPSLRMKVPDHVYVFGSLLLQ